MKNDIFRIFSNSKNYSINLNLRLLEDKNNNIILENIKGKIFWINSSKDVFVSFLMLNNEIRVFDCESKKVFIIIFQNLVSFLKADIEDNNVKLIVNGYDITINLNNFKITFPKNIVKHFDFGEEYENHRKWISPKIIDFDLFNKI